MKLIVAAALACSSVVVLAQKSTPADLAAKLTATWKVNRELSPSVGTARGRAGVSLASGPRLVLASFQRGGRGGGGGGADTTTPQDLTPEQISTRNAVRQLQQIPETLKIAATAEQVTFTEARGVSTYPINNKTVKQQIGDAQIDTKSRWDKDALRQEFNGYQQKLTRTWSVDASGHLVLHVLVETMMVNANGAPTWTQQTATALFDRQQ